MIDLECLFSIAELNTPPNVRVRYVEASESSAIANNTTGEMIVPRPNSIENLLIYLHECAHFVLHRDDEKTPRYLKEFQAETWALDKIQAEDLILSDELLLMSRKRIANDIRGALKNGIQRLDKRAVEFARPCFEAFEQPTIAAMCYGSDSVL
jgi:hypothetical protein